MRKTRILFIAGASLALLLNGCGKKSENSASSGTGTSADRSAAATAAPTPASGREIQITGNDQMKFSVTQIRAKPGESLTVTLRNIGTMPKFSMGHNWVLLKQGTDVEALIADTAQAATTDYIPQNHLKSIIAHTKLLGPKESDSVTFQAPKDPGTYIFLCSFPGHYQVGMKGELIVE